MLVLASECADLFNLGRSDVTRENAAHTTTFVMNFEHDSRRLFSIHRKKTLEDSDYEFHWRVIVIQQQHLVHLRRHRLGTLCFQQTPFLGFRNHEQILYSPVHCATTGADEKTPEIAFFHRNYAAPRQLKLLTQFCSGGRKRLCLNSCCIRVAQSARSRSSNRESGRPANFQFFVRK